MKKLLLFICLLVVSLSVVPPLQAQTKPPVQEIVQQDGGEEEAVEIQTEEEKPEYVLPYPGMLPDHPLYFLKQVRDWILDKLIVDPIRKAEFNVLQADKRLNMGIALMNAQKGALAEEVVSKGEKYLNSAVFGLIAMKNEGKEVPAYVTERLTRSVEKHIELLGELVAKAASGQKAGFEGSLTLVEKLQEELGKLK